MNDLSIAILGAAKYVWRWCHANKSYDFYLQTLENLIQSVYDGNLGGDFRTILDALIVGQINDAYVQAWRDDGNDEDVPDYLYSAAQEDIAQQQGFVDAFYDNIIDARVDQTPVDALLARASMWANRWNESYNNAKLLMARENGEKLKWVLGSTEVHCFSCNKLNGVVAYAHEWDESNVRPQNAPNEFIECGGWNCDCSLEQTDDRRTRNAMDVIMAAVPSK